MKLIKVSYILVVLGSLLITTPALAWPDQAPDKAFISGPGLTGQVEITDQTMLMALKLGAIEDFSQSPIPEPSVKGEGYTITRYFYGGEFNFGVLHYYPGHGNARGYIYFEDGPDLEGNHTMYNRQWLYATPAGDAAMQKMLKNLGVSQPQRTLLALSPSAWRFMLFSTTILAVGLFLFLGSKQTGLNK